MKTTIRAFVIAITLLAIACSSTLAQQRSISKEGPTFSVEIDPTTFVLHGFSAHIRIQPTSCDHLLFGAGIYAMDLPNLIVDFNKKNRAMGWDVRLNQGYGLFGEHHFTEVNKEWFVGAQISIQEYKIENKTLEGVERFSNVLLMGYGGYTLQPFDFNLYFKIWSGIGYSSKVAGRNILQNREYDISPITMVATMHIGYTF